MNATEQRQHKSRLEELSKTIEQVVEAVNQRLEYQSNRTVSLDEAINQERTHRLKLAEEQRRYVDRLEKELRDAMVHYAALHSEAIQRLTLDTHVLTKSSTFWDRLVWLFIGNKIHVSARG